MIHSLTFLSLHDWLIIKFPDVVINLSDGVFFSNLKICLGIFSSAFKWGGFAISFYLILFYLLLSFFIYFSLSSYLFLSVDLFHPIHIFILIMKSFD